MKFTLLRRLMSGRPARMHADPSATPEHADPTTDPSYPEAYHPTREPRRQQLPLLADLELSIAQRVTELAQSGSLDLGTFYVLDREINAAQAGWIESVREAAVARRRVALQLRDHQARIVAADRERLRRLRIEFDVAEVKARHWEAIAEGHPWTLWRDQGPAAPDVRLTAHGQDIVLARVPGLLEPYPGEGEDVEPSVENSIDRELAPDGRDDSTRVLSAVSLDVTEAVEDPVAVTGSPKTKEA